MKIINIIRNLLLSGIALLVFAASTFAAPTIRSGVSNGDVGNLTPSINLFRQDLGGANNGNGNSYPTGRREVSWDDLPENLCLTPSLDIRKYYNTIAPRGMVLADDQSYQCSRSPNFGGPNEVARFGNINPSYLQYFSSYSSSRIFAPDTKTQFDIQFFIPGTNIPATVNGFGIIFLDKDVFEAGKIILYGVNGDEIGRFTPTSENHGLSFLGVSYNDGTRIARVRVIAGNTVLGPSEVVGYSTDVIAIDDIIYGEPRAIGQHSSDFDGDGASDYAVFRPSNGSWYVLKSGSNTFTGVQFGAAGDVPIDGDFDGDSRSDYAVFRPSNGCWYILRSSNGQFQGTAFGQTGDKPVAGDYDRDGKSDIAVWRPSTGAYYYLKSSNGQFSAAQFGANGDIPIGASAP